MAGIYSDCSTREIKITARRYASAVYAVVVCPTVRLSQVGVVSKPLDESSWVWLISTCSTLRFEENWFPLKIRVLSNSGLEKFRHGKSIAL